MAAVKSLVSHKNRGMDELKPFYVLETTVAVAELNGGPRVRPPASKSGLQIDGKAAFYRFWY
jgi:hypothetical protein